MKLIKKAAILVLTAALCLGALTGCGNGAQTFDKTREIGVITRENGSGTRGAFIELFGIEEKNAEGVKVDRTVASAVTTNSTSVMMTTVANDPYAIGYVSLGSLNDTVSAVKIDGVLPTVENIKNGTYGVSRPFNIVTQATVSDAAREFISFILSADGQRVIEANGYIAVSDAAAYVPGAATGSVKVEGSSSVTPVMEKLKEAFEKANAGITVQIQQNDSSTGITSAIEGSCDIGMASRDLKESELSRGVSQTVIAMDGIAVIVNHLSPIENLTKEQVKGIYVGDVTLWSALVGE